MSTTMTAAVGEAGKTVQAAHILAKSVCLVLKCGRFGTRRSINTRTLDIDKDGERLDDQAKKNVAATKMLVDNKKTKELRACNHTIDMARHFLRSVSAAGHRVFGDGTYIVPYAVLTEVEQRLGLFQADLAAHREALKARWTAIVAERAAEMGPLFHAGDYPEADEVAADFRLDWDYVGFQAPDQLMEVDRAVYERAVEKHERRLAAAYDEVVADMYEGALTCCEELAERLTEGTKANGAKKAIRDTALRDLNEYIERLPARASMMGEQERAKLTAAMARVKALSEGVTADTLKQVPSVREGLRAEAAKAAAALRAMVRDVRRTVAFDGLLGG